MSFLTVLYIFQSEIVERGLIQYRVALVGECRAYNMVLTVQTYTLLMKVVEA